MSIIINERNIKRFAYHMGIPAKHFDELTLLKQVTWRVDRACIIMKWYIFPTDVAKQIMCFLGNETETECSKLYASNRSKRLKQIKEFKAESENWLWIETQVYRGGPALRYFEKTLVDSTTELLKLASDMNPSPTNFPWM